MPELPEVETTRSGVAPHVEGEVLERVVVRTTKLRYPLSQAMFRGLKGGRLMSVKRRGKYLLLNFDGSTVLIHLGMSGNLRVLESWFAPDKHDHVDFIFENGICLRYTDPRKFGAVLRVKGNVYEHALLKSLGVEPLERAFNANYLYEASRQRKVAIKALLMDSRTVVGIGNIYASEALFLAGVDPRCIAMKLDKQACQRIVKAIKFVLRRAIKAGGTTLKDFVNGEGKPGYFQQQLEVYGRAGQECHRCGGLIEKFILGQRSTYSCAACQTLML